MSIKEFFQNKIVKIIAWVLLAISIVVLGIGGATAESVSNFVVLVFAGISAVSAIIAFITSVVKDDK